MRGPFSVDVGGRASVASRRLTHTVLLASEYCSGGWAPLRRRPRRPSAVGRSRTARSSVADFARHLLKTAKTSGCEPYSPAALPLDEDTVKYLSREVLQALAQCHAKGVLHRDVKGANVLINGTGER